MGFQWGKRKVRDGSTKGYAEPHPIRYVARSNSTPRVGGWFFLHESLYCTLLYYRNWHPVTTFSATLPLRRHKRQIAPLALSVLRWLWGHIIWKKENKPRIKFTHRLKFYIWSKIIKACLGSTLILSNTNFYTILFLVCYCSKKFANSPLLLYLTL